MANYYLEDQLQHDNQIVAFHRQRISRTQELEPDRGGSNITDATIIERLRLAASADDSDHNAGACLVCTGTLIPTPRP